MIDRGRRGDFPRVEPRLRDEGLVLRTTPGALDFRLDPRGYSGQAHKVVELGCFPLTPGIGSAERLFLQFSARSRGRADQPPPSILVDWLDAEGSSIGQGPRQHRFFPNEQNRDFTLVLQPPGRVSSSVRLRVYQNVGSNYDLTFEGARIHQGSYDHLLRPDGSTAATPSRRSIVWSEKNGDLFVSSPFGVHSFRVPEHRVDYSAFLDSSYLRQVAEHHLFAACEAFFFEDDSRARALLTSREPLGRPRRAGPNVALCFSGGQDSTAALELLGEIAVPIMMVRPYDAYRRSDGAVIRLPDNRPLLEIARSAGAVVVETDFEQIGISTGLPHGLRNTFGYLVAPLILADHFGLGVVAVGSVMEQLFLGSGHRFVNVIDPHRPSPSAVQNRERIFRRAGLALCYPTGACSEVVTSRISRMSRYAELTIPCPQPDARGRPCESCFKCFRKMGIEGRTVSPSSGTLKLLDRFPLKSATSTVYAARGSGFRNDLIDRYRDVDLSWLERYWQEAYEYLAPPGLRERIHRGYERFGIEPMTDRDVGRLQAVGEIFDNPDYGV